MLAKSAAYLLIYWLLLLISAIPVIGTVLLHTRCLSGTAASYPRRSAIYFWQMRRQIPSIYLLVCFRLSISRELIPILAGLSTGVTQCQTRDVEETVC